ncbi:MAG: type 1 glutamine amidotransferase [Pararhodobacter sp.]|nr:type 1 glutamine amidotransferase [Pararhodobacter sp.]
MRIGILQNDSATPAMLPHGDIPGLFARFLRRRGFTFEAFRCHEMTFPASVSACDGWLLTGSRHGAYEERAYLGPLQDFIRAAHAAGVPMVGICFGHQIMAQALGGTVERFAGGWGIGATAYDFGTESLMLNAFHQDQVTTPPPDARTLASNPFCRYAALGYGGRALSFQPHPEIDDPLMAALITEARGEVPDAPLDAAQAGLGTPLDNARIAARIAEFFHSAHERTPSNSLKESC